MIKTQLMHGDCLEVLRTLPDNSVDSIVTDPPAGIAFMGKDWDKDKGGRAGWVAWMTEVAEECLRVIKPGGHALVWAIPRTSHWTGTAWELAGWQPRDKVYHVFGSGFPKSANVSKLIDKKAGAVREVVDVVYNYSGEGRNCMAGDFSGNRNITAPATEAAEQWKGWGTALKPAVEEWWLMRKPLIGTVADNVLQHGTGALNIDGCRVAVDGEENPSLARRAAAGISGKGGMDMHSANRVKQGLPAFTKDIDQYVKGNPGETLGRWPANLIHDGSDDVLAGFPATGASKAAMRGDHQDIRGGNYCNAQGKKIIGTSYVRGHNDNGGSASRFFYCAKASKADRNEGIEDAALQTRQGTRPNSPDETGKFPDHDQRERAGNFHPTVKPEKLMRYLCRLITPPGGTVLDPFMGSGSTGKGAVLEGFDFVGIEREAEYLAIAKARIESAQAEFMTNQPLAPADKAQPAIKDIAQLELA